LPNYIRFSFFIIVVVVVVFVVSTTIILCPMCRSICRRKWVCWSRFSTSWPTGVTCCRRFRWSRGQASSTTSGHTSTCWPRRITSKSLLTNSSSSERSAATPGRLIGRITCLSVRPSVRLSVVP